MPIHITWENEERTIIRHAYEGKWTIQEYYELIRKNYEHIDSVNHTVDIINDLRNTSQLPGDMIPAIRYAIQNRHPNEGINVMVGASALIQMLVEAVNKTTRMTVTQANYVENLEDAYPIIEAEQAKRRTKNSNP